MQRRNQTNESDPRPEAKQRNSRFVFGSSTPRSLDLNSVVLGPSKQNTLASSALVFSASPIRASPDDEPSSGDSRRRPVSAYLFDEYLTSSFANETTNRQITPLTNADISKDNYIYRSALYSEQAKACLTMNDSSQYFNPFNGYVNSAYDENMMSQSLVSLSGISRGRKRHTELTPVMPRERDFTSSTPRITSRETNGGKSGANVEPSRPTPKRAVSMTRLDQLAKPRRRYLEESLKALNSANSREHQVSPTRPVSSLSGSADSKEGVKMRVKPTVPRKPRPVSIGSFHTERKSDSREKVTSPNSDRGNRVIDKKQTTPSQPTPALRSSRARSAGTSPRQLSLASPSSDANTSIASPKPAPPKKPAHLKAAAMTKKAVKQTETPTVSDNKVAVNTGNDSTSEDHELPPKDNNSDERNDSNVPIIEPKLVDTTSTPNSDNGDNAMPSATKKDISEDEYKKMMAEKRKQAREQAEREAELERQRIEKQRLEEEERQRREEEEQRRLEEEQLRLLEEQKRAEEERLLKAMEEVRIKEEEENKRREEEARARFEKEEKERKAKEETERQRLELEERLKKDEEERLARKKKLEAIMSRTRKTTANPVSGSQSNSPNETPEPQLSDSNGSSPEKAREQVNNYQNMLKNDQLNEEQLVIITNSDISSQLKPDIVEDVNRAMRDQINGGSHNNHFSSDNKLDSNNLIEYNGLNSVTTISVDTSLDPLINLNYSAPPNLISTTNSDDVNSNHVSPIIIATPVGDSLKTSQEQTITDLLS